MVATGGGDIGFKFVHSSTDSTVGIDGRGVLLHKPCSDVTPVMALVLSQALLEVSLVILVTVILCESEVPFQTFQDHGFD